MTEGRALTLAGVAHIALFAALSLSWSLFGDDEPLYDEPVSVEFVEIGDMPTVTERLEPTLATQPRETVDAPDVEPEVAELEMEAAELPELSTESELPPVEKPPEPKPEKKPPAAKAPAKPKPKSEAKPAPKKQELTEAVDLSKKQSDKVRTEQDFASMITDALPEQVALSSVQQTTLAGAIRDRIYKCWDPSAGGPDSGSIVTTLRVKAAKSGEIIGRPTMVKQTGSGNAGYKRAARDAAIRAVMNPSCSLKGLPAELYAGGWEDFTLNFDPKDF